MSEMKRCPLCGKEAEKLFESFNNGDEPMSDETEKYFNQLKALRLELFRFAADLDNKIELIENNILTATLEIDGVKRPVFSKPAAIVNSLYQARRQRWYEIFKCEESTFEKLINALSLDHFEG